MNFETIDFVEITDIFSEAWKKNWRQTVNRTKLNQIYYALNLVMHVGFCESVSSTVDTKFLIQEGMFKGLLTNFIKFLVHDMYFSSSWGENHNLAPQKNKQPLQTFIGVYRYISHDWAGIRGGGP